MEARPNEPGTPGTNREEGRRSRFAGTVVHGQKKNGTGREEDWSSLGTDDPAFWLKEPDRD